MGKIPQESMFMFMWGPPKNGFQIQFWTVLSMSWEALANKLFTNQPCMNKCFSNKPYTNEPCTNNILNQYKNNHTNGVSMLQNIYPKEN